MQKSTSEIYEAVMALPEPDRLNLVNDLVHSIPHPQDAGEYDPKFLAELERRPAEMDSGEVQGIPWEAVRDEIREMLKTGVDPRGYRRK